jgi:hypothetical protein
MNSEFAHKDLILEVVDRFLTTWRGTSSATIRTNVWDKSSTLAELAEDGTLFSPDYETNEPIYFPRMLAFELLGDSKRFSFAISIAERWLRKLRQSAIDKGSLEIELLDFHFDPAWPRVADRPMLYLISDFSHFVESLTFVEHQFKDGRTKEVRKIPKIKLRPAIQDFTGIGSAWVDELASRGITPLPKTNKGPLSQAEVSRNTSKRSATDASDFATQSSGISATAKFQFVHSSAIKQIVERDYGEFLKIQKIALKSRFILAGGIIEGLLLDALLQDIPKTMATLPGLKERRPVEEWGLAALLDASVELGLISSGAQSFGHSVREYRNLVHPGLECRTKLTLATEEVEIADRVMEIVIRDLSARSR